MLYQNTRRMAKLGKQKVLRKGHFETNCVYEIFAPSHHMGTFSRAIFLAAKLLAFVVVCYQMRGASCTEASNKKYKLNMVGFVVISLQFCQDAA